MIEFENTLYVVPELIKVGQTGVNLEWHIKEGTGDDIEKIVPGCSCTADAKIEKTRVVAVYTDNSPKEEISKMPGQMKTVSKNLRVFLKDGKPLMVKNARGVDTYNPEKASLTLFFHCNVTI
jgi:hypothetical protein